MDSTPLQGLRAYLDVDIGSEVSPHAVVRCHTDSGIVGEHAVCIWKNAIKKIPLELCQDDGMGVAKHAFGCVKASNISTVQVLDSPQGVGVQEHVRHVLYL
jgi:hypothetical protein